MSIHSKRVRLLAAISLLVLGTACGEGGEEQRPEDASAQVAPEAVGQTEQAAGPIPAACPQCESRSDFWYVAADGTASGWACGAAYPNTYFSISISKKTFYYGGWYWRQIGSGWANAFNSALSAVCGGSPYHQFYINVGTANTGPGEYMMQATDVTGTMYGSVDYVAY